MGRKTRVLACFLLLLSLPAPAGADDTANHLAAAVEAYGRGDAIGALDALWAAQEGLLAAGPLALRHVAFVTAPPSHFGDYTPRRGEDFGPEEPLVIYCEPFGFTQRRGADGLYSYSLTGAFEILDSRGRALGGQGHLGPYGRQGYRSFTAETMLVMTIGQRGLKPGAYLLRLTLTDNLDPAKSVQLEKPFNVVGAQ